MGLAWECRDAVNVVVPGLVELTVQYGRQTLINNYVFKSEADSCFKEKLTGE